MLITLAKTGNEYTATASCAAGQCHATCARKKDAEAQARAGAQQMLGEANRPAEPALTTEPLPGKRLAPEFSTGPLPFAQLVQNLRTITRLG